MKSVGSILDFQELAGRECESVDIRRFREDISLVSPLFSDTQESEEEGSSRCRKDQAEHYFFFNLNACGEQRGGQHWAMEGLPLEVVTPWITAWKTVCSKLETFVLLGRKWRMFMILSKKY